MKAKVVRAPRLTHEQAVVLAAMTLVITGRAPAPINPPPADWAEDDLPF